MRTVSFWWDGTSSRARGTAVNATRHAIYLAASDTNRWLAGAPNLDGEGGVPDITPAGKNVSAWSAEDIAYYLESGFTPDFDTVGGTMVAVQENMAKLTREDRAAIAAYLKSIPASKLRTGAADLNDDS